MWARYSQERRRGATVGPLPLRRRVPCRCRTRGELREHRCGAIASRGERIFTLDAKISCNEGWLLLIADSPNFARACGRVSVGGHPDKRPDSRPERDRKARESSSMRSIIDRDRVARVAAPKTLDRQPEAKPAHPALHGGRGLKQRRSGLFWSRRPSKGRHRRGLFTLARRAEGDLPLQTKAALE